MQPKKRKLSAQVSDIPKRKSLRLAAKFIKSTPEPERIVYEKLTLTLADDGHAVYIEGVKDPETVQEWEFEPTKEGCKVRNLRDQSEKQVTAVNFITAAGEQFVKILKTPDLHLKQLFIGLEPPASICRKVKAAHKMFHPEDKEFKCEPPECIDTLHFSNSLKVLRTLETNLKLLNAKLPVEKFKIEFSGFQSCIAPILSALEPVTLKEIQIDNLWALSTELPFVNLEQWKNAEQLECFGRLDMDVDHWKHFKRLDIEIGTEKERLDEILKTFIFLTTWEQISIKIHISQVRRAEYFGKLDIPATTVIPGIVDNWVIDVPKMNHRVYVIFSDGTLHLFRKHCVPNRKKKVAVRRKYRKLEAVFLELPDVLARNVVERLDEISKRSLRQTCRVFNNVVNTTASTYEKLTLTLADNRPAIFIELFIDAENRLELEFEQDSLGYTVKNPQQGWEQSVVYNQYRHGLKLQFDFIGAAVTQFLKIFTKKTVVKKLCLVTEDSYDVLNFLNRVLPTGTLPAARRDYMSPYSDKFYSNQKELTKTLLNHLSKKQHLLKVEHVEVHQSYSRDVIARVIKFLDPMVLRRINLNGSLSGDDNQEIASFEAWKSAKEFYSSGRLSPALWAHFPKSEVFYPVVSAEDVEAIFNALFASTTWENVLVKSTSSLILAEQFLNRFEDQRPVESRIENSKLIKIPNIPNQFINYQLSRLEHISFTRVIQ